MDNKYLRDFLFGGRKKTIADDVEALDDLWDEYIAYVNDMKADGYTVLRNENGKHKVVKKCEN